MSTLTLSNTNKQSAPKKHAAMYQKETRISILFLNCLDEKLFLKFCIRLHPNGLKILTFNDYHTLLSIILNSYQDNP